MKCVFWPEIASLKPGPSALTADASVGIIFFLYDEKFSKTYEAAKKKTILNWTYRHTICPLEFDKVNPEYERHSILHELNGYLNWMDTWFGIELNWNEINLI